MRKCSRPLMLAHHDLRDEVDHSACRLLWVQFSEDVTGVICLSIYLSSHESEDLGLSDVSRRKRGDTVVVPSECAIFNMSRRRWRNLLSVFWIDASKNYGLYRIMSSEEQRKSVICQGNALRADFEVNIHCSDCSSGELLKCFSDRFSDSFWTSEGLGVKRINVTNVTS